MAYFFLANLEFFYAGGESAKTDRRTIRAKGKGEDFLYILGGKYVLYMRGILQEGHKIYFERKWK